MICTTTPSRAAARLNSGVRLVKSTSPLVKLQQLLEGFLVRQDTPPHRGWDIGGHIATNFDSEHPLQDLADDFAQYSSSGGDCLLSDAEMLPIVSRWLARIRAGGFDS